jgi:hypothetical protein
VVCEGLLTWRGRIGHPIFQIIRAGYDRRPKLPLEKQRKIVGSLVEKNVTGDDEIEIKVSYLPTSEEARKS